MDDPNARTMMQGLVGKRSKNRLSASREPECYDFLSC